ncbi:hypothetical protein Ndes2526B_g06536 [Nannochloris sp. 'desiccata']
MSGVRKEETYRSSDAVYGETGQHTTPVGAKGEELLHNVKSAIPGTKEHQATHPQGAGASGMTGGYSQTTSTHTDDMGPTTGIRHTATNPVTGETTTHSTQMGAKADQMWKDAKPSIPGTVEHKATHPTGTTGTTMASGNPATGPGFTEDPLMKKY